MWSSNCLQTHLKSLICSIFSHQKTFFCPNTVMLRLLSEWAFTDVLAYISPVNEASVALPLCILFTVPPGVLHSSTRLHRSYFLLCVCFPPSRHPLSEKGAGIQLQGNFDVFSARIYCAVDTGAIVHSEQWKSCCWLTNHVKYLSRNGQKCFILEAVPSKHTHTPTSEVNSKVVLNDYKWLNLKLLPF